MAKLKVQSAFTLILISFIVGVPQNAGVANTAGIKSFCYGFYKKKI